MPTTLPLEVVSSVFVVAPEGNSPVARCIRALAILKNAQVVVTGLRITPSGGYAWDGEGIEAVAPEQPDLARAADACITLLLPLVSTPPPPSAWMDDERDTPLDVVAVEVAEPDGETPSERIRSWYDELYTVARMLQGAAVYDDVDLAKEVVASVALLAINALNNLVAEVRR